VVIPLQTEALSHRGVGQLLESIADIKRFTNPGLRVSGVIVTMFDPRTRHAREVLSDVSSLHGVDVLQPPVRKSIRFAEASRAGKPITEFAPSHPGAEAYRQLAALLDGAGNELQARKVRALHRVRTTSLHLHRRVLLLSRGDAGLLCRAGSVDVACALPPSARPLPPLVVSVPGLLAPDMAASAPRPLKR